MPVLFRILILRSLSRDQAIGVAQRTHGTTDPGGVWHPVHRRECLTILLGTYAENGQCNRHGRRTALYSVHQPAYACASLPVFLPIGVCSRCNQLPLYRSGFIGANETGMPCTKGFVFVQVRLCPVSVL